MTEVHTGARTPAGSGQAGEAARQATGQVAGTAREQARQVAGEVSSQARGVASEVRDRVTDQAHTQNDRLAESIRRMSDELREMAAGRADSPAGTVVSTVADSGRKLADHLAQRGPEGLLSEVQEYARRHPGAFLTAALVGGFVAGRLGKSVLSGRNGATSGEGVRPAPRTTAGVSGVGYPEPGVSPPPITPGYPDPLTGPTRPGPWEGPGR